METGACRACGVQMIWAVSINGARQPFDTEPDAAAGNRILVKRTGSSPLAIALTNLTDEARAAAEREGVALYVPHHATCPGREQFRRSRVSRETSNETGG